MLKELFSLFESDAVHKSAMILNIASQVIKTFENEFKTDVSAKNAAIDTFIKALQMYKDPEQTKI